jgi:hypothetical protein
MQLSDYMTREKLRDGEFARRIGRSRVTVNRIRRGLVRPSWDTIKQIRAATNGEVTADDFEVSDTCPGKSLPPDLDPGVDTGFPNKDMRK